MKQSDLLNDIEEALELVRYRKPSQGPLSPEAIAEAAKQPAPQKITVENIQRMRRRLYRDETI